MHHAALLPHERGLPDHALARVSGMTNLEPRRATPSPTRAASGRPRKRGREGVSSSLAGRWMQQRKLLQTEEFLDAASAFNKCTVSEIS